MVNLKSRQIFKTVSALAVALAFANPSHAWFWDNNNERKMRMTPEGQLVPIEQNSWLERATTYHEELKPVYDPKTQRVVMPTSPIFNGVNTRTETSTVEPAWYDRATTYREEQRRPWNPYDVEEKQIPAYMYYDKKEALSYNKHYEQKDLEAVPYMYGSASLVLRREAQLADLELVRNKDLKHIKESAKKKDSRIVGMDDLYIRPAGGFDSIDSRGSQNEMQLARSNGIVMGDAVTARDGVDRFNNVMIGNPRSADVQAATKITDPNTNWRDKLKTEVSMSRPGDFDYKKKEGKSLAKPYSKNMNNDAMYNGFEDGGQVIAATGGTSAMHGANSYNQYANGNVEKLDNYLVENGDTLSEISDKEKIYGDWTLWPLIYDANRNQVQDPDLIEPGQNLDIPRDYNTMAEDDARYRAKNREMPISLYDNK